MDHRIRAIISILSSDPKFEVSLVETATHMNLSVSRFRHLFKTETGTSVVQYVKNLKLEKAKELIETTPLNIKQIMAEVGIQDKSNFCRDFKKAYGLSPLKYRREFRSISTGSAAVFTNK